ncbi:MAG: hypothetical protein C4519_21440 [Desulfobacteraceae bacterium]|nr:MAG: hypothetical protein C4519_21440 [Desulfobacteraceae bacterium]
MKTFKSLNYYEILKIPANADAAAIQRAYSEALEIYDKDSLVTYSLFSEEERADVLQSVDEAFHTLIDEDKRSAYNRVLIDSGQIDAAALASGPRQAPLTPADRPGPVKHRDLATWVKKKSQEEGIKALAEGVVNKDMISGKDLKQLREVFEIDLGEIFEATRISVSVLKMIEEEQFANMPADVFLRAFLKSYAQILNIDPQRVMDGYLKFKASAGPRFTKNRS